ncbi:hypothetical protein SLEP1_g11762 [Rubroshorea leprosula]|nr:hypothetical protein SLEP1_g11762 [Rubroshorea leprosula]
MLVRFARRYALSRDHFLQMHWLRSSLGRSAWSLGFLKNTFVGGL